MTIDSEIRVLVRLRQAGDGARWKLGARLHVVHVSEVWKKRASSWTYFVEKELSMTRRHANYLMRVAMQFSLRQFIQLGLKKLDIVARLPQAQHAKFIRLAQNTTIEALRRAVNEALGLSQETTVGSLSGFLREQLVREFDSHLRRILNENDAHSARRLANELPFKSADAFARFVEKRKVNRNGRPPLRRAA